MSISKCVCKVTIGLIYTTEFYPETEKRIASFKGKQVCWKNSHFIWNKNHPELEILWYFIHRERLERVLLTE